MNTLVLSARGGGDSIDVAFSDDVLYSPYTLRGLVDEALNLSGIGTLVSGVTAGSSAALEGQVFLAWINNAWQQDQLLPEPIHP